MRNILTLFVQTNVNLLLTSQNGVFVRYFEEEGEKEVYRERQEDALRQMISLFPHLIESAGFTDLEGNVISSVANWISFIGIN